jgi:chaperonin cofactor prefoldin
MNETDVVFKQIGPTLIKQNLSTAKETVQHRVDHFKETLIALESA